MQSAETVLDVLRDRGRRGLPCDELYRQLFNPASVPDGPTGRIYANDGAMTPGPCGETADGMSLAKIGRIIDALRHERYRFQPVKRVYVVADEFPFPVTRQVLERGRARFNIYCSPCHDYTGAGGG